MRKEITLEYVPENGSRDNRKHNICVAILQLFELVELGVDNACLRRCIRKSLKYPVLYGEQNNGDKKAHGDALRELNIDTIQITKSGKKTKYIIFSDKTKKVCKQYLKQTSRV